MRHIENPGIVRTVYSGIFRHIQGHSASIQPCSGQYSVMFRHISFFYTIDLHKRNTKTKKFTKQTYNRVLPDISRSDRGNKSKKKRNPCICIHK